jgi:tetratricopeptide (TPR) repeat protein
MNTNTGSWLAAHGKLWYDDPWYRTAWMVWPQAVGLLVFVSVWLFQPGVPGFIPWAKPFVETPRDVLTPVAKNPATQPVNEKPADLSAECDSKEDEYQKIIQACTSLLASGDLKESDIAYAYEQRGLAYYSTTQYQLAMKDYDRAMAIEPSALAFYNDRAVLSMELGNYDRAMQDLDQAILQWPEYALAIMNRGVLLDRLQRPKEALVALSRAIELDPTLRDAFRSRVRTNEALVALSRAIQFDPTLRGAFKSRILIYEKHSDWRAVIDDANKLIELTPKDATGYVSRGRAYLELGQYEPAIADFTKAISTDPSVLYGYRMRGRAYYFLNQFDNARADFEAALRIDAKDSDTISYMNDLKRLQR